MFKKFFILLFGLFLFENNSLFGQTNLQWNWTLTGGHTGSGTFISVPTISNGNPFFLSIYGYLVTGASGVVDGFSITGVDDLTHASAGEFDQMILDSTAGGRIIDEFGLILTTDNISNPYFMLFLNRSQGNYDSGFLSAESPSSSVLSVVKVEPTPEPGTFGLVGLGIVGLIAFNRCIFCTFRRLGC